MSSETALYLESLKVICPGLTGSELNLFAGKLTIRHYEKKDFFLEAGKVQEALGFIARGLVRSFYIDEEGNERTVGFYAESDYATHYPSFITRQASKYFIQCLEPTTIICLSFDDLQWVYGQSAEFERYGRLIAEEVLKRQQARIESFIFHTAEERYLDFIKNQKTLFNRVSLSHLCSFLGIERQSLTRIRNKIARR